MVPDVNAAKAVVETMRSELEDREKQLLALEDEWTGKAMSDTAKTRSNDLNSQIEEYETRLQLAIRDHRKAEIADRARERNGGLETPMVKRPGAVEDDMIYNIRSITFDPFNPEATGRELKDRAFRSVKNLDYGRSSRISLEDAQTRVDGLLRNLDTNDGKIARHLLVTGSPAYKRAFRQMLQGGWLSQEENDALTYARAMSLTGTSGGFAVPYELDPSIIPVSDGGINPYRAIARVVNITVDEWRGVASGAVTAAYDTEAAVATAGDPTLAQPTITTDKARAFVPFSIEIGMDWGSIQSELGGLISDAKDDLEATKFTLGDNSDEPQGIITGATTVYTAAATNAITASDLFGWHAALAPRYRARSTFVMNIGVINKIRQWDTSGGSMLLVPNLQQGVASTGAYQPSAGRMMVNLFERPVYESSAMSQTFTTGQLIGVFGDFNYYVIVERLGMTVEVIPHLFSATTGYPMGQRGLYAYWRNGAEVIDPAAFRTLKLA